MNFSTQLRVILLIAGGVAMLLLYLLGQRHGRVAERTGQSAVRNPTPAVQDFGPAAEVDEDELETPTYLRRTQQEVRHREEPLPSVTLPAGAADWDDEPLHDDALPAGDFKPISAHAEHQLDEEDEAEDELTHYSAPTLRQEQIIESSSQPFMDVIHVETVVYGEPVVDELSQGIFAAEREEPSTPDNDHRKPESVLASGPEVPWVTQEHDAMAPLEPPTIPSLTVGHEAPVLQNVVAEPAVESAALKPEPVKPASALDKPAEHAPKPAANAAKRKIVALRLSMPQRIEGAQLLSLFQKENLVHGRFGIFHRMQDDASVFSIASMVEPGSFDLATMHDHQYPGVTLFMLLPGPLDGLVAWDQMLSCAQRLAHAVQGVLQDERGYKLTSMVTDRLREEVLDFQHLIGSLDIKVN